MMELENRLGFIGQETLESAVAKLRDKGAEFARAYNELLANYAYVKDDPALLSEWSEIKSYADKVRGVIEYINGAVAGATQWISDTFGLSGFAALSAVPLVPVAYVLSATAALTYVLGRMYEFNQKVSLVKAGRAEPGILDSSAPTVIGEAGTLLKWVVIGAALYFAAPIVIRKLRGK